MNSGGHILGTNTPTPVEVVADGHHQPVVGLFLIGKHGEADIPGSHSCRFPHRTLYVVS